MLIMTDQVFHIIVAVAVGLACLMFIVQAFVMVGLLKAIKRIEDRFTPLTARAEPVIENLGAVTAKLGPVVEEATPLLKKAGPAIDRASAALERVGPLADKLSATVDQVNKVLAQANKIIEDTRPKISEVSNEVAAISHSGREQIERLGDFLQDAGARAQSRLEQIDQTVENTVGNIEQVGDAVKRTVMRPVREMNGIAAGISAAVSSLVGKPRKYSVDSATQDEEMFI